MEVTRFGRHWTGSELEFLRRNNRIVPTSSICRELGRSIQSVHSVAHKVGVTRPTYKVPVRPWLPEEDGILLELYGTLRPPQIAEELGRTVGSVHHRAEVLGLMSRRWSSEFRRRQSLPRKGQPFTGLPEPAAAGYVAGIIDGEGSILGPPRVVVSVTTTTESLALALRTLVGGTVAGPYLYARHKRFGNQLCKLKPQYHWNFSSQYEVYRLLKRLRPYLVVKAEEAERGIFYFESNLNWRIK